MSFVIAVDGPAASGKGTIATRLGGLYGLPVLDTGLLYRAAPVFRADWFAWERVLSYLVLITFVFAWRLWLIIRPPQPPGGDGS